MTGMFQNHFLSQPTPGPVLHDEILRWDDIFHDTYDDYWIFSKNHADLRILGSDGSRPDTLHVLWQVLKRVPNRDSVTADVQSFFQHPPSLAEFTDIINAENGHSSGGPSGLQYNDYQKIGT